MPGRARVTLAVLARDHSGSLEATIESARPFVDEVVVRDTGSTDNTIEVAVDAGARVVRGSWHNDFASARNLLLASCRTDWVLMIDADETLSSGGKRLHTILRDPKTTACSIDIESNVGFGRVERTRAVRLFRRGAGVGYHYRVHEMVRGIKRPSPAPLTISHAGFSGAQRRGKTVRDLALVEMDILENPGDPYPLWRRARTLRLLQRDESRYSTLEKMAHALCSMEVSALAHLGFAPEALADWVDELTPHLSVDLAIPLATRVVLAHPRRPLARYLHARVLGLANRSEHALSAARRLLESERWHFSIPGEEEILTHHAPRLLATLRQGLELPARV